MTPERERELLERLAAPEAERPGPLGERSVRNKSGMPWVGDIPIVGNMFKTTDRRIVKTELVILLKPTIIAGDETWKQDLRESRERLEELQYTPPPNLLKPGGENDQATSKRP